jgi:hypothetical protein
MMHHALCYLLYLSPPSLAGEVEFEALVDKMEHDVMDLRDEVESLYQSRCTTIHLEECPRGNYDHCRSSYLGQTCPGTPDRYIPDCGDGTETEPSSEYLCMRRSRVSAESSNRNGGTQAQITYPSPPSGSPVVAQMTIPFAMVVPMAPPGSKNP